MLRGVALVNSNHAVLDAPEAYKIASQPQVIFKVYRPCPPLSDVVDSFWYYASALPAHDKEYHLPNGAMQLLINLRNDEIRVYGKQHHDDSQRLRGIVLCGMYSEPFVIDTLTQSEMLGVCFKPDGAFPFLRLPASELHNLHLSLEDLWGGYARRLYDQLLSARTVTDKFCVLEESLLSRLFNAASRHPAIGYALQSIHRTPSILDLSESLGLSHKHLIHLFKQQVGLSPKLYARIQRFQSALHSLPDDQPISWSDVALTAGYFDQAHFIHDFRTFAGVTPITYQAQRTAGHNHVKIPD